MARSRTTLSAWIAAVALALLGPAAAHAASLHIQDAEATVAQGESATFTILLSADGALTCTSTATVAVDSMYSINTAGAVASGDPSDVTFSAAANHGSGHNCDPTWDGAPNPYQLAATATAAAATPLGDYTAPVHYVVKNAGKGPAGKLSNAGTVNVTIHVVAPQPPPTIIQPPVVIPQPEQQVLGVREAPLRPTFAKTEMLTLVKGTVRYRAPHGNVTVLGSDPVVVPNGTLIDATDGVVKVTVERTPGGALDTADAWAGGFNTRQDKGGTTTFTLAGKITAGKGGRAAHASRFAHASKKKQKQLLWVNGAGKFKTRGKRASAIVRGTFWLTEDSGTTTKVSVKRGAVAVRDLVKRRTILVTAGHSYTARERKATVRRVPAFTGSLR